MMTKTEHLAACLLSLWPDWKLPEGKSRMPFSQCTLKMGVRGEDGETQDSKTMVQLCS